MSSGGVALLIAVASGMYILSILYCRSKVRDYMEMNYLDLTIGRVVWTLFGPFGPGTKNIKFRVDCTDASGVEITYYAVTSVFGDVFIREDY